VVADIVTTNNMSSNYFSFLFNWPSVPVLTRVCKRFQSNHLTIMGSRTLLVSLLFVQIQHLQFSQHSFCFVFSIALMSRKTD